MSESATEKHLIDPDDWFLPEDAKKDVVFVHTDTLKELWEDIVYNFAKELDRKLMDNVILSQR